MLRNGMAHYIRAVGNITWGSRAQYIGPVGTLH